MESLVLYGMKIIESPYHAKYRLPTEIMPGIPWPKGFRDEMNDWALDFFGVMNYLAPGTCYKIGKDIIVMHPVDVAKLAVAKEQGRL